MRWALLPLLPIAAITAVLTWWAARRASPRQGWDAFLAFPLSSVIATAVGTLLVAIWWQGPIPAILDGRTDTAARLGGLLIGVGIACALVRPVVLRLVIGVPLALFGLIIVGPGATGILAVIYALAATAWWGHRLWHLARTPIDTTAHAR